MSVYLDDGDCVLHHGDALATLRTMPSASVHCIVTSPPFWALRDYGVEGQIGLEGSPSEWCEALVAVFREARRVLRPDGVAWIEVGDTYAGSWGAQGREGETPGISSRQIAEAPRKASRTGAIPPGADFKPKDLVGAPWLLAFALRADGWYLRSDTIWSRPNPMPESVTDRPTKAHSYIFLLSREPRYFYDPDAIRDAAANDPRAGGRQAALARRDDKYAQAAFKDAHDDGRVARLNATKRRTVRPGGDTHGDGQGSGEMSFPADTANARSVWTIPTEPTTFKHFATFPQALVARCIKAGSSEHGCCVECGAPWRRSSRRIDDPSTGPHRAPNHLERTGGAITGGTARSTLGSTPTRDQTGWAATCSCNADVEPCTILDPFAGSATALLVARRLGRRSIGIELSDKYLAIAATRLQQLSLIESDAT